MDRLLDIGFIKVGSWALRNDRLVCNLDSHHTNSNILYSFSSNGDVKYVGKTIMPLARRMYGYQNPGKSQSTNIRVNARIIDSLKGEEAVDIFILVDNGLLKFGDFKINLAAGLEDTVIYELVPEWNFMGKRKIEEDTESNSPELIPGGDPLLAKPIASFEVSLGKAYYNQGFFNVRVEYSELFGSDGSKIEIRLGNEANPTSGYINRTANGNGTPRIMTGKRYTEWIQSNFRMGDVLKVDVLTPSLIRLNHQGS